MGTPAYLGTPMYPTTKSCFHKHTLSFDIDSIMNKPKNCFAHNEGQPAIDNADC